MTPTSIPEPVWHALGWAMVHFLWMGAVAGLLVAVVARLLLQRATPNVRYGFGLASLALLALIAGACVWKAWPGAGAGGETREFSPPTAASVPSEVGEGFARPVPTAFAEGWVEAGASGVAAAVEPAFGAAVGFEWVAVLPWIWLVGSTGFAAVLGFGFVGAWRLRRGVSLHGTCALRARCDALCERLGMRARVGVAVSARVTSPLLLGVFRPLIVLPTSAVSGMPPEMIEWILLHELAHARRLDNAVIVLQRLLECVLFFHPAVWLVSRWMDREREFCCDRFALAHNADRDPAGYAETLARLAGVPDLAFAPVSAMASHAVVHRIRRVLNAKRNDLHGGGGGAAMGVFLIGLISSAMMLWAFSEPEPEGETPAAPKAEVVDHPASEEGRKSEGVLDEPDRRSETKEGVPADLQPIEPEAKNPERNSPEWRANRAGLLNEVDAVWNAEEAASASMVAKVYPVDPDFMKHFGGKDSSLKDFLEKRGFNFPKGALALFEPRLARVVLRHDEAAIQRIEREIEKVVPDRQPMVLLTCKLTSVKGKKQSEIATPSVVTRLMQRAKVEVVRELIVPGKQAVELGVLEAGVEPPEFEMIPLGLQWETMPEKRNGMNIGVKGEIVLRLPQGTDLADLESPSLGELELPDPKILKGLDTFSAPFEETVRSGESFEVSLGSAEDRRFLEKIGRPPATLSATVTATFIPPSGQSMNTEDDLRKAFPPFRMHASRITERDLKRSDHLMTLALAAFDLGDYPVAESTARTALAFDPGNWERRAFWEEAFNGMKGQPRRKGGDAREWLDRSYRLRPPLLPAACTVGGDEGATALRAFLVERGMGFPDGATAMLVERGTRVVIHNRREEVEKLEAGLKDWISYFADGRVSATVEVFVGPIEVMKSYIDIGEAVDGQVGIAGVFTDEQFALISKREIPEGVRRQSLPPRIIAFGRKMDVFDKLQMGRSTALLGAVVGSDETTIEADISIAQWNAQGGDGNSSTNSAVTVWDKQWIALGGWKEDGTSFLVFVRLEIVRN